MSNPLSRRGFLRSAGGLTFLALVPQGRGLFSAASHLPALRIPVFSALPYLQPGPEGRLVAGAETVRVAWQTEPQAADFELHFGTDGAYSQLGTVARTERHYPEKFERSSTFNYVGELTGLRLGTEYRYRVRCNRETIAEGYFTTRQPRGRKIRFVAFGDNAFGEPGERAVAFYAYREHPDFIMNTGDNVYDGGLDSEYTRHFFPVYNADAASPHVGAPLLRSIPFYTVLANHDVNAKHPETHIGCADFGASPDSLAYYTNFHFPLNGPAAPTYPTVTHGPAEALQDFRACAGARFPTMANYSYDAGDAHFLCLDSNAYTDATDPGLQQWIEADLAGTDALWKFVTFHHPPFNIGVHHSHEQQMRVLAPLFERHGVSFVLSGHEHNYQRTRPLRFSPHDLSGAHHLHGKERLVPGDIHLDLTFDGGERTQPDGIIYLTTGAGGKDLYDPTYNENPSKWALPADNNVVYTVKMVSDRHSFTVFDLTGNELLMRQIDEAGTEIDRIRLTKGAVA